MPSYSELLRALRRQLRGLGVEEDFLEAREILCMASGLTREQLIRDLPLPAPPGTAERSDALLARRRTGEPLAFLLGEWEFSGLTLEVSRDTLIPRADTEVLAERAVEAVRRAGPRARVLDLCAGSGCVGLAVASRVPGCTVILGELSEPALEICRRNIRRCALESRVEERSVDALRAPDPSLGPFDVLVCNPPYIPTEDLAGLDVSVRDFEPRMALDGGGDGLNFYRAIVSAWKAVLRPGSVALFEVGIGQAGAVENLMRAHGFSGVRCTKDTGGILRVVEGEWGGPPPAQS